MRQTLLGFVLAPLLAMPAIAAGGVARDPATIPVNDLLNETQRASSSTEIVDLVWWITPQFWEVMLAREDSVDASARREIVEVFGKYVVVAAVQGNIGNFGVDGFVGEADMRRRLTLRDSRGRTHQPLPQDTLDPRLLVMLGTLKPVMANVAGQLGSNLNFYAFEGKAPDGSPVADPFAEGRMTIAIGDTEYPFRLPLGSLLQPMADPASGETFPGDYRFNPYTGSALKMLPAAQPQPQPQPASQE